MPDVDFAQLKEQVPIADVALRLLGLTLPKTGTNKDGFTYFRGRCPICKSDKCFTVTIGKGWYCHGRCKTGGDQIKLVAAVKGIQPRDAALLIQEYFISGSPPPASPAQKPPGDRAQMLENILARLQPDHDAVQALGISAETARQFESGYCPSGKQAGRYSVAIRDLKSELIAFAGIALTEEQSPQLAFSNFDPATAMFNHHRLAAGTEIILFWSPLDAILAVENGAPIDSVTSFLTTPVTAPQFQYLADLLDRLKSPGLLL